jgi:ribonuclease D
MSIRRTGNPALVYNAAALAKMLEHISQRRLWALDTESDSLYSYYPKICLIQITVPDAASDSASGDARAVTDYLVDPLRTRSAAWARRWPTRRTR